MEYALVRGENKNIWEITKSMSQFTDCSFKTFKMFDPTDSQTCSAYSNDHDKFTIEEEEQYKHMFPGKWRKPFYPVPFQAS